MLTSHNTTATRLRNQPRRLSAFAGLMVAAIALGGCTGGVGPTLTAADLQQGSSLAPWQVAGPTVAQASPEARLLDGQRCYGGDSGLVDDCDPMSVRYDGP